MVVGKHAKVDKTAQTNHSKYEFSVEWLPSHTGGLQQLLDLFGIDTTSEATYAGYVQPHLLSGLTRQASLCRKHRGGFEQATGTSAPLPCGFMNVCPEFFHTTLLLVNPPADMSLPEAKACIKKDMSADLRQVADAEPPVITFHGTVQEGKARGARKVFRVDSSESAGLRERQTIEQTREKLWGIFEKHGFRARIPREDPDRIHMTIRDERFETTKVYPRGDRPKVPSLHLPFTVMFDKLAVTPAGEEAARHSFRTPCGATLRLNIFSEARRLFAPKCFVQGTHFRCPNGSLISVDEIQPHEILQARDGSNVEVVEVHHHEAEQRELVWMEAGDVGLIVTSDHRISVRRGCHTEPFPANKMRVGMHVLTSQGEQELSSVETFQHMAKRFELKFLPDQDMETFYDGAVATRGARGIESRRTRAKAKAEAKAAQKHRAGSSVPDTYVAMEEGPRPFLRLVDLV